MKSSAVLASLLFGSYAIAAPFDKRSLVYKTETVTETVVIYTTVYDDEPAATTSSEGLFYEQPHQATAAASPTSTYVAPAYTPAAPAQPTSVYSAPAQPSSPAPAPEEPSTTVAPYVAPTPAATSDVPAAPAPKPTQYTPATSPSGPTTTSGDTYSGVDITIYDNTGAFGACGTALHDEDMIVAIAQPAWGTSTYDVMTGEATNPWCRQKVRIEYEGKSIDATVMDMCPGCVGHDLDLSLAAWTALTGKAEKTRLKASWSKIS